MEKEGKKTAGENEAIMFTIGFFILIGIFLLQLGIFVEFRELVNAVKSLPHCSEEESSDKEEGDNN